MPVASCVATGTACGRHPVASLLSMPVASCVATGTACGLHPVASLLSMREGFPQKLPLHQPAFPACVPKGGTGFFLLWPSSHRGAISESPSAAALFRYGRLACPAACSTCMDTPLSHGPSGHSHCILHRPRLPCSPNSRPARGNARRQPRCPKTGPPYATG